MAFFGTYLEVTPHSRLVWTNEEGGEGGPVTTVTFEDKAGKTLLVLHELYSSKEALDAAGTPGRERGTVMTSSISRFPLTRRQTMRRQDGRQEIDRRTPQCRHGELLFYREERVR
jgi:uncharacterized protein YndB with AHSA1/START domain